MERQLETFAKLVLVLMVGVVFRLKRGWQRTTADFLAAKCEQKSGLAVEAGSLLPLPSETPIIMPSSASAAQSEPLRSHQTWFAHVAFIRMRNCISVHHKGENFADTQRQAIRNLT